MKTFRSHNGRFSRDINDCVLTQVVRNRNVPANAINAAFARAVDVRAIRTKIAS